MGGLFVTVDAESAADGRGKLAVARAALRHRVPVRFDEELRPFILASDLTAEQAEVILADGWIADGDSAGGMRLV